jgi:hypothetical protein
MLLASSVTSLVGASRIGADIRPIHAAGMTPEYPADMAGIRTEGERNRDR